MSNFLSMMLRLKMIGPERKHRKTGAYNTEEHRRAVLDVARESKILLKKEEQQLQLQAQSRCKVAVNGAIRSGEEVQKSRHCMRYHRLWESKSYLVEM